MARIVAIDYGSKRTGIAVTDPMKMIASGLTTVPTATVIDFLKNYFSKEEVECIVVGDPKNLNNTPASVAASVNQFVKQLEATFPDRPVKRMDERFTSKMATHAILVSGVNKKTRQDKALVDKVSATLILQSYLETI